MLKSLKPVGLYQAILPIILILQCTVSQVTAVGLFQKAKDKAYAIYGNWHNSSDNLKEGYIIVRLWWPTYTFLVGDDRFLFKEYMQDLAVKFDQKKGIPSLKHSKIQTIMHDIAKKKYPHGLAKETYGPFSDNPSWIYVPMKDYPQIENDVWVNYVLRYLNDIQCVKSPYKGCVVLDKKEFLEYKQKYNPNPTVIDLTQS